MTTSIDYRSAARELISLQQCLQADLPYHINLVDAIGADAPFFLDYAYTNIPVKSFRLFPWDKEMSDHIGMELEI